MPPANLSAAGRWRRLITVIGLNASVDRTLVVPDMRLGAVLRVAEEERTAGGKGVNVARCLRQMGLSVRLVTLLGADSGRWVGREMQAMGVDLVAVPAAQPTRMCDVVIDPAGGHPTVLNGAGPQVTAAEWRALDRAVQDALAMAAGDLVVATGSLPPGVPVDAYAVWTEAARRRGAWLLVDASGEALRYACMARPDLVKVNANELREAFGGEAGQTAVVGALLAGGVGQVVVTDGGRGADAWGPDWRLHVDALPAPLVNPVGCGDAFTAGLVAARAAKSTPGEALCTAAACAAASLARRTPGLGHGVDVAALSRQATVRPWPT